MPKKWEPMISFSTVIAVPSLSRKRSITGPPLLHGPPRVGRSMRLLRLLAVVRRASTTMSCQSHSQSEFTFRALPIYTLPFVLPPRDLDFGNHPDIREIGISGIRATAT